jgi:hypothetical protein
MHLLFSFSYLPPALLYCVSAAFEARPVGTIVGIPLLRILSSLLLGPLLLSLFLTPLLILSSHASEKAACRSAYGSSFPGITGDCSNSKSS